MRLRNQRPCKIGQRKIKVKAKPSILSVLALSAGVIRNSHARGVGVYVITKSDINPFFVKMKEGATAKTEEFSIKLSSSK